MDKIPPLVTVTIPTKNSAATLALCLASVAAQSYRAIEVTIVDGYSTDNTLPVAKKYGVKKIILYRGALLGSRVQGIQSARGTYTLILDSDQILNRNTISAAVAKCEREHLDMLALEEDVYESKTWLQWLFKMDRKVINNENNLSPETGVILPRFFRTSVLRKAVRSIDKKLLETTGGPDHAVIYYESYKISHNVGILKKSVRHMEPASLSVFLKKFYRWGYTGASAKTNTEYGQLMAKKERFRTGLFKKGIIIASFASVLLLLLKGIPYKIGYFRAKLNG